MLGQSKLSRSRPLIQSTADKKINKLYSPLREALRQSSKSKQKSRLNYENAYNDLKFSKISEKARMIDPVQAEYLINSIYVPDIELKPTTNVSRVKSKSFVVIQVNIKKSAPIEQKQFMQRLKNANSRSQIAYQLNYNTTNQCSGPNIPSKLRTISNPITSHLKGQRSHKADSIDSQNSYNKFLENTKSTARNQIDKYQSRSSNELLFSRNNQRQRIETSDFVLTQIEKNPYFVNGSSAGGKLDFDNVEEDKKMMGRRVVEKDKNVQKNLTQSSKSGITLVDQEQIENLKKFSITNTNVEGETDNSNIKKKGLGRGLTLTSKKNEYRYNIFSCLDQPVNSNCRSCGKLELFASKKQHIWN